MSIVSGIECKRISEGEREGNVIYEAAVVVIVSHEVCVYFYKLITCRS